MTVQPTYPGVYLQEIPSGNRTLTGVATAVAAFVGRALRGSVDEPVPISSFGEFERVFGGLWLGSGLGYAVRDYFLNGGSSAIVLRLAGGAQTASVTADGLTFSASSPGGWGTFVTVTITHSVTTDVDAQAAAGAQGPPITVADLFNVTVMEAPPGGSVTTEQFNSVTVIDGPRRIDVVLRGSRLITVSRPQQASPPFPADGDHQLAIATEPADGNLALQQDDYLGGVTGESDSKGIYGLRRSDPFTLLCLPPSDLADRVPDGVWSVALQLCKEQNAFLLVDPPPSTPATPFADLLTLRDAVASGGELLRYGALYFPRLNEFDPLRGGAIGEFVPCGAVAGVMARTDVTRGVWKAPAGIDAGLAGVTGLPFRLTDTDSGKLNPIGINTLRTFPNVGTVVWGARTLRGGDVAADDYKYVPVRRLASFLEESLYRGTQWVVFEPNDEPLWRQIRSSIGGFMQNLFRQGAFQGATPKQAYFVQCDAQTTTQYDIDRGVVNIIVGFAPLKPAEFVVISIAQLTADATA